MNTSDGASPILIGHNLWTEEIYHKMSTDVSFDEYEKIYKLLDRKAIFKDGKKFVRIKKDLWKVLCSTTVYKYIYGKRMSDSFVAGFTGLKELTAHLENLYNTEGGITIGIGKKIWFKDARTALNYSMQGSNSYVTKLWVFYTSEVARSKGMKIPEDYIPLTIVHDEINQSIKEELASTLEEGIKYTNRSLKYKYPVQIDSFCFTDWSMH